MRYIIIVGHLQVKFCVTWLDFTAHGPFFKNPSALFSNILLKI
jgi:hypothetical protein